MAQCDIKSISFTIPCYNSANTITTVIEEIESFMSKRKSISFDIICVVDGSPDNVFEVLCRLAIERAYLRVILLAKNTGKHAALLAGYKYVTGDIVVTLDDDGECPVSETWKLIEPLSNGYDLSMARYGKRPVSFVKNIEHKINDYTMRMLTNKQQGVEFSNFSARKRFICNELVKYEGPFPYLEGQTLSITRNIAIVDLPARRRISGSSGYTFKRGMKLFINGCTSYSFKILRVSFVVSIACVVSAIIYMCSGISKGSDVVDVIWLMLFAFLFCYLGLLGEFIGRLCMTINRMPQYVIRDSINLESTDKDNNTYS